MNCCGVSVMNRAPGGCKRSRTQGSRAGALSSCARRMVTAPTTAPTQPGNVSKSTPALRAYVRAVRETGQIPEGVRGDVFLVADQNVFRNEPVNKGVPSSRSDTNDIVCLRAVDPDHDPFASSIPPEESYAGFDGEITVPLPKVFDWLYYTFFAGSESWPGRYRETKTKDWTLWLLPFPPYSGYGR